MTPRLALLAAAVAVLALPGAAQAAGWTASKVDSPDGAVDDAGRVAVVYDTDGAPRVALLTPGRPRTVAALPGEFVMGSIVAFTRDGAVVAGGSTGIDEPRRPAFYRWHPGGTATRTPAAPPGPGGYGLSGFGADARGDLFAAELPRVEGGTAYLAHVSAGGGPARLRALPDGILPQLGVSALHTGATAFWEQGADAIDRLAWSSRAPGSGWQTPRENLSVPVADDRQVGADAHGHVVSASSREHQLWVRVDGGREQLVTTLAPVVNPHWSLAVGADGTSALAWVRDHRMVVRRLRPGGRLTAVADAGPATAHTLPEVAVDARGRAHLTWLLDESTLLVWGPHGRHTIRAPQISLDGGIQVSPRGAELVFYGGSGHLHAASRPA